MIYRGLVVTGTDTEVGKTEVSVGLVRAIRERGIKVGVLKPVETGCQRTGDDLSPADGLRLMAAAEVDEPVEKVVPYRYEKPLAPYQAAVLEGKPLDVERIFQSFEDMIARHDLILVESAGGVMVPLNDNFIFADLLKAFDLPVVVVAANRLGVINHTLLTLEALRSRGLRVLGVVLNRICEGDEPSLSSNAEQISKFGKVDVLADVPYIEAPGRERAMFETCLKFVDGVLDDMDRDWRTSIARYLEK